MGIKEFDPYGFFVGLIHFAFVSDVHFPAAQVVVVQTFLAQIVVFVYDCPTYGLAVEDDFFVVAVVLDVEVALVPGLADVVAAKEVAAIIATRRTRYIDFILFTR